MFEVVKMNNDPPSTDLEARPPPAGTPPPPLRESPGSGQPFLVGMNAVVGGRCRPPDSSEGLQASGRARAKGGGEVARGRGCWGPRSRAA